MKCPSCEVIFPDHIKGCPRCKVDLVGDNAPPDPKLMEEFKKRIQQARERASVKASEKPAKGRSGRQRVKAEAPPAQKPVAPEPKKPAEPAAKPEPAAAARVEPVARPEPAVEVRTRVSEPAHKPYVPPTYSETPSEPSKLKLPLMIGAAAVLVLVLLVVWWLSGKESRAFKEAQRLNTVEAFQGFVQQFPEGALKDQARLGIAKLKLDAANAAPTIAGLESYVKEFADTEYAAEAKKTLEGLLFKEAVEKDDLALYRSFVDQFPKSPSASQARERAEQLARIKAFFEEAGYITRKVEAKAVGDSLATWASENLRSGDTLYAFTRGGDQLGACMLRDIMSNTSRYRDLNATRGQVDYYAIQFPSFQPAGSSKLQIGVVFADASTWIRGSDMEEIKKRLVEVIRQAAPEETFTLVYPAEAAAPYWGTVTVAYKDQRYTQAVEVPRELGGRAMRTKATLTLELKTDASLNHTWKRAVASANAPREFPLGIKEGNPDVVLRDAAIRLLAASLPRLEPR